MKTALKYFRDLCDQIEQDGLTKNEKIMTSPQGAKVQLQDGRTLINMCANNYLGLANNPEVIQAARDCYGQYGYGLSSVLPSGFLVSRRTLDSCSLCPTFSRTGLLPCFADLSKSILLTRTITLCKSLPDSYFYKSFGLVRFRSPLLSESLFAFFSSG